MNFRRANLSDAPAIAALHAASWRHAYKGALSDDYLEHHADADRQKLWLGRLQAPLEGQSVLLAEQGDELQGFACVFTQDHPQWGALLDNIHVALPHQRSGLGTALLQQAAQCCAEQAPRSGLYLWVLQSNLPAQHFYRKLGASVCGDDVWQPPGGGAVPRFRMAWPSAAALLAAASRARNHTAQTA